MSRQTAPKALENGSLEVVFVGHQKIGFPASWRNPVNAQERAVERTGKGHAIDDPARTIREDPLLHILVGGNFTPGLPAIL